MSEPTGTPVAEKPIRLTPLQRRCLRVIIRHVEKNGHPPSLQEIADALHISKTAAVWRVRKLHEKGAITRAYGVHRGIRIVEEVAR